MELPSGDVVLSQEAKWASEGTAKITITKANNDFSLYLRVPEWSENTIIKVNGKKVTASVVNGYAVIKRNWQQGDYVEITADMTPARVYSDPRVTADVGRVALKRGPVVYCLEGTDNATGKTDIVPYAFLPENGEITLGKINDLYGGTITLKAQGMYVNEKGEEVKTTLTAIPFYTRANRGNSSLRVWIPEDRSLVPNYPDNVKGGSFYVDFEKEKDIDRFDIYSSSSSYFDIDDGKLSSNGSGEMKAILKGTEKLTEFDASVVIHANQGYNGIDGGLYLLASDPNSQQDSITAYNVQVESLEGNNDVVINVFKFKDKQYQGSLTSTTITNVFSSYNPKFDVSIRVVVKNGKLDVYFNSSSNPILRGIDVSDFSMGSIGLRAQHSNISFDNLSVISPQITGNEAENASDTPKEEQKPKKETTYAFKSVKEALDFDFYHSSNGGFAIRDGKLSTIGEKGESKAILRGSNRNYRTVSVDIYPGKDNIINSGIYIGASEAGHTVDKIKALGVLVQSDFEGWEDAPNRIDIIFGEFPKWKELNRITSEKGNNNELFTNGKKEPLNLQVSIDGNKLTVKLSLISNPGKYIKSVYKYTGALNLTNGKAGIRSMFDDCSFDNFKIEYNESNDQSDSTVSESTETNNKSNVNSANIDDTVNTEETDVIKQDGSNKESDDIVPEDIKKIESNADSKRTGNIWSVVLPIAGAGIIASLVIIVTCIKKKKNKGVE